jgi:hypothetical protein
MNLAELTQDTINKAALAFAEHRKGAGGLQKSIDLGTGLQGTPLEAPAKLLVPLLSPFRQSIARETIGTKSQAYRRITAVTPSGGFFPAEGVKANLFTLTTDNPSITFRSYGRGGNTTWEAQIGGQSYEDAKARDETLLSLQVLKEEELVIIGGNRTALGGPSSPALTAQTSGGALADATYRARVFALTMEAAARVSRIARPAAGNKIDGSLTPVPTADTSVGFSATSGEVNAVLTGGGGAGTITMTWAPKPGAVAYAVYVSTTSGAGNQKLQCVVTQTKVVLTNINTTAAADPTGGDTSANTAAFDGIIPQLFAAGSNAYIKALSGPLSAAVGIGIPEIDAMCNDIYDRTKVEPDRLLCGWQEASGISTKLASVANDRINLNVQVSPSGSFGASLPRIDVYKTPRGKVIPIEENPNMAGGMILGLIDNVPYPNSEIPAAWKMWMGSDLVRLDYALTDPKYAYEIRAFGALAGYAPALQGVIHDIWAF